MNVKKLLLSTLAGGVLLNILDMLFHGMILKNTYAAFPTLFNADAPVWIYIVSDFLAALIFTIVYEKLKGSSNPGAGAGANFGFFAGLLITFPGMVSMSAMLVGFPYWLSWVWLISGIVWYVALGAVVGGIYQKVK